MVTATLIKFIIYVWKIIYWTYSIKLFYIASKKKLYLYNVQEARKIETINSRIYETVRYILVSSHMLGANTS